MSASVSARMTAVPSTSATCDLVCKITTVLQLSSRGHGPGQGWGFRVTESGPPSCSHLRAPTRRLDPSECAWPQGFEVRTITERILTYLNYGGSYPFKVSYIPLEGRESQLSNGVLLMCWVTVPEGMSTAKYRTHPSSPTWPLSVLLSDGRV